jgi:urease accessory protein
MGRKTMLQITEKIDASAVPSASLTLPFEKRQKSRLRALLDDNQEVALMLERGTLLRHGDLLRADNGLVVEVRAAEEEVAVVSTEDPWLFARTCYHLGNRHVPLQIGDSWLRFQRDHVLEEMVRTLGLAVRHESAPFEPEGGAYGGHRGHEHGHSHEP